MNLTRFLVSRLLQMIPVLIGMSLIVFVLLRLAPGDPATLLLGEGATDEDYEAMRRTLGLDRPLFVQYAMFLSRAIVGDLGYSYSYGDPVIRLIAERLPATIELALASLLIGVAIAIPLGVVAAVRQNSFVDAASMTAGLAGISLPNFWLGLMLIYFFAGQWQLLPSSGRLDFWYAVEPITHLNIIDQLLHRNWEGFRSAVAHLIMPAVTLGTALAGEVTRLTRSSMLETIREDYVRTAYAKGLTWRRVVWKHAFRNSMITVVTVVGLQLGTLMSGSIITETVFAWPGMGSLLINAISYRDYNLVQGIVLFFAMMYIVINLLVDFLYHALDPRIKV